MIRNIKNLKSPGLSMNEIKNLKSPVLSVNGTDHFRESFKHFKHKKKLEDISAVIDFETQNTSESVIPYANSVKSDVWDKCLSCDKLGLLPHNQWRIYSLKGFGGFMFIRNPFTTNGQQQWIKNCMEQYTRKPSITNLDRHHKFIDDIWSLQKCDDPVKSKYIDKLTWATLGYHYDWDAKVYDPANHSDFPKCLADLAKHIAVRLNFASFKPEAAIVNYYNLKSTLGIHCDNSEENLDEPIISFSFGQTAIFLLGTVSKTEKPVPIFLRSGDIVILSGNCRTSYHAVPSIIEEPVSNRYFVSDDNEEWKPFHQYIEKHRINISVRQVYRSNTDVQK